jgi:hypothetical protein
MKTGRSGAAMIAATLALAGAARAAAPPSDDALSPPISYAVKPRDTLYALGRDYLVHLGDFRTVQRLNKVANPRRLRPGAVLVIPFDLLKTRPIAASLVAVSGPVTVERDSRAAPARVGLAVVEGMRLTTGADAFLTLELADESRITLPSNTSGRVVRLREVLLTGALERVLDLDDGRSETSATPNANPGSRFMIRTPLVVAAVRGTEFRVAEDAARGRAATEVLKGRVGVSPAVRDPKAPDAGEVATPAGFGISASAKGVGAPVKLLAAPGLIRGGRIQEDPAVAFQIEPLAGAAAYRLQLANDAGFIDIFAETVTPTAQAQFAGVADGTYFARVTAIDADGLEGLATSYSFERDLNTLAAGGGPKAEGAGKLRRFLFRWSASGEGVKTYRFQIFADAEGRTVLVDQPGLTDPRLVLTNLPAGQYYWRVTATRFSRGRITEKVGALQDLRIGE